MIIRSFGYIRLIVLALKTNTLIHTHTVPSTGLQNAPCSIFCILWECAVIQQFGVGAECQDLETKRGVSIKGGEGYDIKKSCTGYCTRQERLVDVNLIKEISFIDTDSERRC